MKASTRWWLYGVAGLFTAGGMLYVDRSEISATPVAVARTAEPTVSRTQPSAPTGWLLPARSHGEAMGDPFDTDTTPPLALAQPVEQTPPVSAETPTASAPPLPFSYVGQWAERGVTVAFLATPQGLNVVARQGAMLEGDYRVERVDAQGMTVTYVPLNQRQTLSFADDRGGAPVAAAATTAAATVDTGIEETN